MPQHTYNDLETLVGRLKQSAIDALMCQGGQGYFSRHPAEWQKSGDGVHYEHNGYVGDSCGSLLNEPAQCRRVVLRPDERGGGSQGEQWDDGTFVGTPFKGEFDNTRGAIDQLVWKWRDLPDPARLAGVVEDLAKVYKDLIIESAESSTGKTEIDEASGTDSLRPPQNATLTAAVRTMTSAAGYLHGTTASMFKTMFIGTAEPKINNFCKVALPLYSFMVRQQAMWDGARKDVASILEAGRSRFDAVARGSSDDWTQELKILGYVNNAVGGIAKDPLVKLASNATKFGLEEASSAQVRNGNVGTYDDVMVALARSLDQLNAEIRAQEDGIRRWAVDLLNIIWDDRGNYRLRGGVRGAPEDVLSNSRGAAALYLDEIDERAEFVVGIENAIKWNFAIAAGIATDMDFLAGLLKGIARINSSPEVAGGIRSHVVRDSTVGVGGGYGPSHAVQELNEALHDLLDNMAGDWEAGAENLRAASAYFQALEEGNVGQLDTLRQEIDAAADDVLDGTGIEIHDYRNISWWDRMGGR